MKLLGTILATAFSACTLLLLLSGLAWGLDLPVSLAVLGLFAPVFMVGSFLGFLHRWWRTGQVVNFHMLVVLSSVVAMGPFYKFGLARPDADTATTDHWTVLSYNARKFNQDNDLPIPDAYERILDFLRKNPSDVACIQECHYTMKRSKALDSVYPYAFVDFILNQNRPNDHVIHGIFSRYPMIHTQVIEFPGSYNRAVYADIVREEDTVRVYSIHLQSFKIKPEGTIHQKNGFSGLWKRMEQVIRKQEEQVELLRNDIERSPYPVVVTGDFNNTQYSRVYRNLARGMKDSYLAHGHSFGRTYDLLRFPMRIDFILADEDEFRFVEHSNYSDQYSDHYPIRAVFQKKDE